MLESNVKFSLRAYVYRIMESGYQGDRISQIFSWTMIALIVLSSTIVVLETVAILQDKYGASFDFIETRRKKG